MKTKQTTVRMHMNPIEALGSVSHVLDKDFRDKEYHVNPSGEFEVWINKGVYDTYKEVFGKEIEEYNKRQKRKDRRITDENGDSITAYIKSIKDSKRGKRWYRRHMVTERWRLSKSRRQTDSESCMSVWCLLATATKRSMTEEEQSIPRTDMKSMGHSDIGVTMNTYTHLGLDDAKNEMIRMEELEQARKGVDKAEGIKLMKQNMFKVV